MKLDTLSALLAEQIRHLYDAENVLVKALARMAKKATSPELRAAFDEHRNQTEQHVLRLEEVFAHLDAKAKKRKCEGLRGLVKEARALLEIKSEPSVRDAGLIAVAQRIEHYEISAYGTARAWAQQLGLPHVADTLGDILEEETAADQKLTALATHKVNHQAEVGTEEPQPSNGVLTAD